MTGASRRQRIQALLFAAIMVVSMVAAGVGGLAGRTAGETTVSDEGSIQDTINDAESGELITVESGSYDGFVVNKSVRIQAVDGATVTSDGVKVGDSDRDGSVVVTADDVVIDGIELDGENSDTNGGVIVEGATNLTINSSDIHDYRTGITFGSEGTTDSEITIEQNTISNNTAGIGSTDGVQGLEIDGNNFNENEEGIGLGGGVSVESISNNDFESNDRHIKDYRSDVNETLLQNVKSGNNFDVAVTVENDTGTLQTGIFGSIQPAVDNAQDGDTVRVPPGTYDESVSIDTENITLEGPNAGTDGNANRGTEAIINGMVELLANDTVVRGFTISPSELTEKPAAGIYISESNTTAENNIIEGIRGDGSVSVHGVQVFKQSEPQIGNITVANNLIHDVDNAGEAGVGIKIQNQLEDVHVHSNTIEDVHSMGWTYGIVSTPSSVDTIQPQGVLIENNSINAVGNGDTYDVFANEGEAPYPGTAVGLDTAGGSSEDDPTANASEVLVNNNAFLDVPYGIQNKDRSSDLSATSNWWGATNGPSGDFDGNGSAVTGPVSVDPATVSLDDGSVSLTQDFLGVVEDSQNVTLNDTSDATFSFDSESVPGDVDGTLVLGINGTDYVFEDVLDDGAINTSASGAEVDSGKNGTSIANTTPTGDTAITVVGNNSTTAVDNAGTIRLVHEVQNIGEGYTLTSLPQPAEVYTTDVSDFTSWSNADSNYDDSALSAGDGTLVDDSEALHKGQYANGESSDARIGYDYDTSGDRVNPGIEELNEGYNLVGSNYDISGSTVELNKDLSTTRNVPDTPGEYQGNESFAVYNPATFGEVGGTTPVGNYEAYWVYVDTGEDSETRTIKVPKYDPAAS